MSLIIKPVKISLNANGVRFLILLWRMERSSKLTLISPFFPPPNSFFKILNSVSFFIRFRERTREGVISLKPFSASICENLRPK